MLSISEFSEMCQLSPRTLRFYHSEGLLVPADVDGRNGYRSYTFDQVERAMLITVLRGTGMSLELVRQALDEPDQASELLRRHDMEVRRQRQAQDEAINDAREFLESWPEVRRRHVPETTVVSKVVPGGPSDGAHESYWEQTDAIVDATIRELVEIVESRQGMRISGTPWRTFANETPEEKQQLLSIEGPHWRVCVPVTADPTATSTLPDDIQTRTFGAREELSIFIPGRTSSAKYGTALARLSTHPLEDAYVDVPRMRQLLHEDGVETAATLHPLDAPFSDE